MFLHVFNWKRPVFILPSYYTLKKCIIIIIIPSDVYNIFYNNNMTKVNNCCKLLELKGPLETCSVPVRTELLYLLLQCDMMVK
jgi:hypothetical protein